MIDLILAWSGGKDSTLTFTALRADPRYRVVALLTTVTREYDRISIHGVRRAVLEAQVSALGIPLIEASIPAGSSNADYEAAFALALGTAQERWPGVRQVAFGDLFLADVRAYREAQLASLGWIGVFPLWGEDTAVLARRFVESGYRAILTCVDTTQLGPEFAGREFDAALLAELPETVDPSGERGEFLTCEYAGPPYARPLRLIAGERVRRDARFEYCDVLLAPARAADAGISEQPEGAESAIFTLPATPAAHLHIHDRAP
jgi:diphthamide synthase (EF-2-diphthine--ammonia ligase)